MSPTEKKVREMDLWQDHGLSLPEGIVAKRNGSLGVLENVSKKKFTGFSIDFLEKNPESLSGLLARIS